MSFIAFGLGGSLSDLLRLGFESGEAAVADAASVWAFILSNGKSAGENVVEILAGINVLLARSCFEDQAQGVYTYGDIMRILAAFAAGKTHIVQGGAGAANVKFDAIDDSGTVIDADMQGSERINVTLTPTEST